jgi:hypothetical protein
MNDLSSEKLIEYESLTPKLKHDDKIKHYFSALDYAFSQRDVRNIAVTGPFGAGKSTVIQSYLTKHNETAHVNVSLAGFEISGSKKDKTDLREVELSILQQILYTVDRDTLPDSRIDRIQDRNGSHVRGLFTSLLLIIIPLFLSFILISPEILSSHLQMPYVWSENIKSFFITRGITIIALVLICIYFVTQTASRAGFFDKKLKLSKIAFLEGEAETTSKENSSLLNNCLDEMVYFFSRSEYKTVVFEDLDRLGTAEIFIKLREINKIINNSKRVKDSVRFVYAVRDDIFLGSDVRAKFFDFIVPVIPFMDSRNAYSILKAKLSDFPDDRQKCLRGTSLYITDMRSLVNIINEYHLFMSVVDNKSNKPQLYSLIFYKNLYAIDYNLADKKLGILYSYMHDFRSKKLHRIFLDPLEKNLSELEMKIKQANSEIHETAKDVRSEIVCRYISKYLWGQIYFKTKSGNTYNPSWVHYSASSLIDDEAVFLRLFSHGNEVFIGPNDNYNYYSMIEKDDQSRVVEQYNDRSSVTLNSRKEFIILTQKEIYDIRKAMRKYASMSLASLTQIIGREKFDELAKGYISKINDKEVLPPEQEKKVLGSLKYGGLDALYYLITNGYLMQDFMMYRSIFHKGSLSENDNEYIKMVGNYISCDEANSYAIDNVDSVLRELVENAYTHRDGALHHQIIAYILDNKDKLQNEHNDTLEYVRGKSPAELLRVLEVLHRNFTNYNHLDKLISNLATDSDAIDDFTGLLVNTESGIVQSQIITTLMTSTDLRLSNRKSDLKQYVRECGWSLVSSLEESQVISFMENARVLNVVFDHVSRVSSKTEQVAAEFVADSNMFALERETFINVITAKLKSYEYTANYVSKFPLTLLKEHNLVNILEYIYSNIDTFAMNIFITSHEGKDSILELLNHGKLDIQIKSELIKKMTFTIANHTEVADEDVWKTDDSSITLHDLLYTHDRVMPPSWSVLLDYISSDCDKNALRGYLTRNAESLSNINSSIEPIDMTEELYNKVICDVELSDSTYKNITSVISISTELIDARVTITNLSRLAKNSSIQLNPDSYLHIIDCFHGKAGLVDFLLEWLSRHQDVIAQDLQFYFGSDKRIFPTIFLEAINYEQLNLRLRAELAQHLITEHGVSILVDVDIPEDVIDLILTAQLNASLKLDFLTYCLDSNNFTKLKVIQLVERLNEPEAKKIFQFKVQATIQTDMPEAMLRFLETMKRKRMISSFVDEGLGRIVVKP